MLLFIGTRTIFCLKIRLVCSRHGYHDYVVRRAKMRTLARPFSLDMMLNRVRHIILKHLSIMFLSVTYPQNNSIRLYAPEVVLRWSNLFLYLMSFSIPARKKKIPS